MQQVRGEVDVGVDADADANVEAGVDDDVADAFALYGDWEQIAEQLQSVLDIGLPVSHVLPHPILEKAYEYDFLGECAGQLMPHFR